MAKQATSTTHDFDEEQLAQLTDEERAEFLAENDGDEADNDEGESNESDQEDADGDSGDADGDDDGGGDDDDDGATGDDTDGADGGDDDGSGDAGGDETGVADKADKPADGAPPDKQAPPVVDFKAPENAKQRLDEIAEERAKLRKEFEDGELTESEYWEKVDPLDDERNDLRVEIKLAEQSQRMREAQEETAGENWSNTTVPTFLKANAIYEENDVLLDALDRQVRRLQTAALEAGESQHNPAFLQQAHEQVMAAFGRSTDRKTPAANGGKRNPADIPPTLGGLPAAGMEDTSVAGKFDRLDKLSGEAHEAAFAKLSEAEQEEYLNSR